MINGGSKFGVYMNQKKIPCNAMKRPKSKKLFETAILNKVNKITNKLGIKLRSQKRISFSV